MKVRKIVLLAVALLLLAAGALAGAGAWAWKRLHEPYKAYGESQTVVEVPSGASARRILEQLADRGVLQDALLTRLYFTYVIDQPALQAGEYLFDQPLTAPQVIDRLTRGDVLLHSFTLIEGLDLEETALHLANEEFGEYETFLTVMSTPDLIADLDPEAENLEGYLFPDTYAFARGASEIEIVSELVSTFRRRFEDMVRPLLAAAESDDLEGSGEATGTDEPTEPAEETDLRSLVTLASIIEKEAQRDEERPLIAAVYQNRLDRGIALYADPTVIHALKLLGRWDGNIRRPDLQLDHPYNTYRYPGLPPGPICSPGAASLAAAAQPADVPYLYFVSKNDGTHVFARTLAEHNRNVREWQRDYWRRKWAEERAQTEEGRSK